MESRVHPDLKPLFSALPEMKSGNEEVVEKSANEVVTESRKQIHQVYEAYIQPPDDLVNKSYQTIPGPEGAPNVPIVIYEPKEKASALSGILWIHGGAFIVGIPEMDDALCRRFVLETNSLVVSVDYRLAPENPFPAPLEDCYAALKWFAENAIQLGLILIVLLSQEPVQEVD